MSALLPGIRDKVGGEQCVQDFLYLGPFPFPEGNQPRDHQPQRDWLGLPTGLDNLARIDTDAEVPVDPEKPQGRKLKWTRPFEGKWGRVDLKKPFKRQIEFANGFMLTFVHSDAAAAARLWIGSDDGIAVWLNGKRVHALDIQRALTPDEDLVEVALKPGWNPLLVRVSQGYGGWELALRITDARGLPWPKQKIDPACGGQPRPEIPVPAPVKEEKQEVRKEAAGR
ncbi:MAG: hypothetical protein M5U26_21555 [Planctomycetota bacterium]|nr:hypothetical protein [Planctomycetota bacterium]